MAKRIRLVFFVLGLAFFCYLVSQFGIKNIYLNIQKTGWWLVPVIAVWGLGYFFNTLTWRAILGKEAGDVGFWKLYGINLSSFALNYVTPFINLGGEPYRAMSIQEVTGSHRAISSAILFRMVHTLGHLFFCLAAVFVAGILGSFPGKMRLALLTIGLVLLLLIGFILSAHKKGILEVFLKVVSRIVPLRFLASRLDKWEASLLKIDLYIRELYNQRRRVFYRALSYEVCSRLAVSFEFFFILNSVGYRISVLDAIYISAGSSMIMNAFFFIPFEMGTREGSLYLLMGTMSFPPGIGVYVGLVSRIREFFWIITGLGIVQLTGRSAASAKGFVIEDLESHD